MNFLINFLWLGVVIMFFGGVFFLFLSGLVNFVQWCSLVVLVLVRLLVVMVGGGLLLSFLSVRVDDFTMVMFGVMKCVCEVVGDRVFDECKIFFDCFCLYG